MASSSAGATSGMDISSEVSRNKDSLLTTPPRETPETIEELKELYLKYRKRAEGLQVMFDKYGGWTGVKDAKDELLRLREEKKQLLEKIKSHRDEYKRRLEDDNKKVEQQAKLISRQNKEIASLKEELRAKKANESDARLDTAALYVEKEREKSRVEALEKELRDLKGKVNEAEVELGADTKRRKATGKEVRKASGKRAPTKLAYMACYRLGRQYRLGAIQPIVRTKAWKIVKGSVFVAFAKEGGTDIRNALDIKQKSTNCSMTTGEYRTPELISNLAKGYAKRTQSFNAACPTKQLQKRIQDLMASEYGKAVHLCEEYTTAVVYAMNAHVAEPIYHNGWKLTLTPTGCATPLEYVQMQPLYIQAAIKEGVDFSGINKQWDEMKNADKIQGKDLAESEKTVQNAKWDLLKSILGKLQAQRMKSLNRSVGKEAKTKEFAGRSLSKKGFFPVYSSFNENVRWIETVQGYNRNQKINLSTVVIPEELQTPECSYAADEPPPFNDVFDSSDDEKVAHNKLRPTKEAVLKRFPIKGRAYPDGEIGEEEEDEFWNFAKRKRKRAVSKKKEQKTNPKKSQRVTNDGSGEETSEGDSDYEEAMEMKRQERGNLAKNVASGGSSDSNPDDRTEMTANGRFVKPSNSGEGDVEKVISGSPKSTVSFEQSFGPNDYPPVVAHSAEAIQNWQALTAEQRKKWIKTVPKGLLEKKVPKGPSADNPPEAFKKSEAAMKAWKRLTVQQRQAFLDQQNKSKRKQN